MSSSSSISSSSSSPLPTTKSSSNNKKAKNERKEDGAKNSTTSSLKKPSSNGSTNKSSSSNNHQEETVKSSNEICTNKKNSSDKKKSTTVNCNGNTKTSVNSVRDNNVEEKESISEKTLQNVRSKKVSGASVKQPPTAIEELYSLASMLDFSVTYTNFPQKNKTDIVTLVKLTTNPPKV